jgi:hypothetical protein
MDLFEEKQNFLIYLVTFSLFLAQKTNFRIGRHESQEKYLFYFGLRIFVPIQILL